MQLEESNLAKAIKLEVVMYLAQRFQGDEGRVEVFMGSSRMVIMFAVGEPPVALVNIPYEIREYPKIFLDALKEALRVGSGIGSIHTLSPRHSQASFSCERGIVHQDKVTITWEDYGLELKNSVRLDVVQVQALIQILESFWSDEVPNWVYQT